MSHTLQKEIENPNTPDYVKKEASSLIFTECVELTLDEKTKLEKIYSLLTGNAKPDAHRADATHIFQAAKYGGCFITRDKRILKKRDALQDLGAVVLTPSEWVADFQRSSNS